MCTVRQLEPSIILTEDRVSGPKAALVCPSQWKTKVRVEQYFIFEILRYSINQLQVI